MVELAGFLLTPDGLESSADPALGCAGQVLDATWPAAEGPGGLRAACACASARRRSWPSASGARLLVVLGRGRRPRGGTGAGAVAAGGRGGAAAAAPRGPGHPDQPGRRHRGAGRLPPGGHPARLRGRRHLPPGSPWPPRPPRSTWTRRPPRTATADALDGGRVQDHVQDGHLGAWTPTGGRRSSRPSAWTRRSIDLASPAPRPRSAGSSLRRAGAATPSTGTGPARPRWRGWRTRLVHSTAPAASTTPPTPR